MSDPTAHPDPAAPPPTTHGHQLSPLLVRLIIFAVLAALAVLAVWAIDRHALARQGPLPSTDRAGSSLTHSQEPPS